MIQDTVTIEYAIKVAKRRVQWPSMAVMFSPLLGFLLLAELEMIPTVGYAGLYWFAPTFFGGIIGGWLIWSLRIPKWMLWAYPRVKSIHQLKEQAIAEQLIWPDGSIFNKTLIMSSSDRKRLDQYENISP